MNITFLLFILGTTFGLFLLGTLVSWGACRLARVPVTSVRVLHGPAISTLPVFGTRLIIGCIPAGCSLEFDIPAFSRKPLLTRLAVILSGPAALLVFAAAFLSLPQAASQFSSGFYQLVYGAIHPKTTALECITRLHFIFSSSAPTAAGIIAAKLTALALLPLGGMSTAESIRQILSPRGERGAVETFVTISAMVAILLGILWLVAILIYSFNGNP